MTHGPKYMEQWIEDEVEKAAQIDAAFHRDPLKHTRNRSEPSTAWIWAMVVAGIAGLTAVVVFT